jgi:hypothetical protein
MEYKEIMMLPGTAENTEIFDLLKGTVTPDDIKNGTKPETFAYAHLIEWAVKNKKFEEYYSYIRQFENGKETWDAQENLTKDKAVLVKFNCVGKSLFGFYCEEDGESGLCFPEKDGMYVVFL